MSTDPYIIQWNTNGLESRIRLGELERLLKKYRPMCICLQHLGKYDIKVKEYQLASQSRNVVGELGTAIYVHNSITYQKLTINNPHFQHSSIALDVPGKGIINIINFYNQPKFNYNINNLIDIINLVDSPKIILGDVNCHSPLWDPNTGVPDNNARKIEDLLEKKNITCLNEEDSYTFYSKAHNKMTTVDISLCSDDIQEEWEWHVLDDQFSSDHFPIVLTSLKTDIPHEPEKRYKTSCADWKKYTDLTNRIQEFDENIDIEESYSILKNTILEAAKESIPQTSGKKRRKEVPWWTDNLQKLIDKKHKISHLLDRKSKHLSRLKSKVRNTACEINKIKTLEEELKKLKPEHNKVGAQFKREAIQAKMESWKGYVSKLTDGTPIKKIWRRFRKINGSNNKAPRHAIWYNGRRVHEIPEMCKVIGEHLQGVSSDRFYTENFRKYKEEKERNKIKFTEDPQNEEYYNINFDAEELTAALKSSNNSSPGEDKIDFPMITNLSKKAKVYLIKLYNHLWNKKKFISEWRNATIIPIPKPGKDPGNVANYRPISLTSCLCKTFEKMVNTRLTWYLRENKIISDLQFGSIKNRSTLDPLIKLEHHIRKGFNRKTPTVAIFYDIEKAYDSTWRYPIIEKLKTAGLKGALPSFIANFLEDRTFKVKIDSHYSDTYQLQNSIPQGSVLSCTLFHLAIDDIIKDLPTSVKKSLYMDDFIIYISARKLSVAARLLNLANRKIEKWEKKTGFRMSEGKTKMVIFYRDKRWIKEQIINVTLNNKLISVEKEYKFLGLIFDCHLNWNKHISYTKARCRKALNLLRKLSHTTWGADRKTLRTLYRATVLSILDYGSQIYGSATQAKLSLLEPIHNEGARIITGAFRSTYVPSLHVECGDLPLDLHRDLNAMKAALRVQSSDSPVRDLFNEEETYSGQAPFTIRAKQLLDRAEVKVEHQETRETIPPWTLLRAEVCTGLLSIRKSDNPHIIKSKAIEHIRSKQDSYNIYTDGSKSDKGVGYAVVTRDTTIKKSLPTISSVYTAEIAALLQAVETIETMNHAKYTIYSDSRSAIEAMQQFNPKSTIVKDIQTRIDALIRAGKLVTLCWIPAHVGLDGNEAADKAAKEAIEAERSDVLPPITDYYPSLREIQIKKWQRRWDMEPPRNKLRSIKQEVRPWRHGRLDRTTEVTLARLRLGHTRITHCHLMERPNGPEPICTGCQVNLTVQHMLVECPLVAPQRRITIGTEPLNKVLGPEPHIGKLTKFLKIVGINKVI